MNLNSSSKLLKAVLAGAADPAPQFVCAYRDEYPDREVAVVRGETEIVANGATEVTLAAAPSDGAVRVIESIHCYNADNASATVSIFVDDGSTNWILMKVALATLEHMSWTPGSGWKVFEADGTLKVATA